MGSGHQKLEVKLECPRGFRGVQSSMYIWDASTEERYLHS